MPRTNKKRKNSLIDYSKECFSLYRYYDDFLGVPQGTLFNVNLCNLFTMRFNLDHVLEENEYIFNVKISPFALKIKEFVKHCTYNTMIYPVEKIKKDLYQDSTPCFSSSLVPQFKYILE